MLNHGRALPAVSAQFWIAGHLECVQRKGLPGAAVDGETSNTLHFSREVTITIAGVPAKLSESFDFGVKDEGSLHRGAAGIKGGVLSTQKVIERSGEGLDAKVQGSLVKGSADLLASGQLPAPLSQLPLTVKAEVTGLEAGLSFKKLDLKLMGIGVVIEGDMTAWLPEDVQAHFDAKASIQLEFQLDPQLAEDMIQLAKDADNIKRQAVLETKIAATEKKLDELRRIKTTPAELEKLGPGTLRNHLAAAPGEIRKLEKELNKLRGLRGRVSELRARAAEELVKIGERLEKRVAGRLIKKFAGKALAFVFKKFLPIYNTISTIEDIYEAGKFLAGLNWEDIGKKIVDGGDGGSSLDDGTHHEGFDGGSGEGTAGGDDLPDADELQAELDRKDHIQLHPAAQSIVDAIEAKGADARPGAHPLSAQEKETIDAVVPDDLTPDEIKTISDQLNAAGSDPQSTVQAVIAAVQRIRPFGEKRLGPAVKPDDATAPAVEVKAHPSKHTPRKDHRAAGASSPIVDLEPALARVIAVNAESGKAHYERWIDINGVSILLVSVQTARYSTEDDGFLLKVQVRVETIPQGAALRFRDGTPVVPGVEQTVVFGTGADLTVHASDK